MTSNSHLKSLSTEMGKLSQPSSFLFKLSNYWIMNAEICVTLEFDSDGGNWDFGIPLSTPFFFPIEIYLHH